MEALRRMEEFVDRAAQSVARDRFVQHDIDGLRLRTGDFDQCAEAGEHDHWNVLIELFDEARGLFAAHLRHNAIDHHEIEWMTAKFFERFTATGSGGNLMSIATQVSAE